MDLKTKNSRASGKAGSSSSIMSLGLFLYGGSQCLHTYHFNMEFGREIKELFPPSSSCKSSRTYSNWVWLGHVPISEPVTAAGGCTIQMGQPGSCDLPGD